MNVSLSVAVMAHPKRKLFVPELLATLDRPAIVVWDAGDNNRWNTGRRAMLARDPQATHHLVLQDDAVTCRDLVAGVERALESVPDGSPLSLYCGRTQPYRELVKQLVGRVTSGTSWLSMAQLHWGVGIVMPTKWINEMVAWCDQRTDVANYDKRISRWIQRRGLAVYYPWPSLVDHRDSPSLVPGRGSANRRAHRFLGADRSALRQRWDGAVVTIPALSLTDSPAPVQIGGRGPVRFASVKYPELHIPTIEVRFRGGFAEVTRRSAIAYLNSPWMRRRGVRLASEVEEESSSGTVSPPTTTAEPEGLAAEAESNPVPNGTATVVLAWVGTDRDRAHEALKAEQARPKPRASLVAKLAPLARRRVVAGNASATLPSLTANDTEENSDG